MSHEDAIQEVSKATDIVSAFESDVDYRKRLMEIAKIEDLSLVLPISLSGGGDLDKHGKSLKTIRILTTIAKMVKKDK